MTLLPTSSGLLEPANTDHAVDCLFVISSLGRGGAERATITLANAISRAGLNVQIAAISTDGHYSRDIDADVAVYEVGGSQRARSVLLPLARHLRSLRPAHVISTMNYVNVIVIVSNLLAGGPAKVHVTVQNHLSSELQCSSYSLRDRKVVLPAMRLLYRLATSVVALTDEMANDLSQVIGLPREKIVVLPNLVDLARIDREVAKNDKPVHPWLTDKARPTVVSLGRLVPQKDYATLLAAMALLPRSERPRLLIFGEGPERSMLEMQISDLDLSEEVILAGITTDPFSVLSHATLLVLSSQWEGFAMVLLEALAVGCPVVATDCPTGPAEILENGRFGSLVPVGHPDAMANAIRKALLRPPRAACARRRAEDFAATAGAARYIEALGLGSKQ